MVLQIGLAVVLGIGIGVVLYGLVQQQATHQQSYHARHDTPHPNSFTQKSQKPTRGKSIRRRKPKKEEEDDICVICIEPILDNKKLRCNHRFHQHCIDKWFQTSKMTKCPYRCQ